MRNKQFLILQAIAIILVVVGHLGGIQFLSLDEKFPIYSYHMALFAFISGYFFKAENAKNIPLFIWNKTKRLIFPFFGWNLIYGIIYVLLTKFGVIDYATTHNAPAIITFDTFFVQAWQHSGQYLFNVATWFVIALFVTHIFYVLIRCIYDLLKLKKEWTLQIFFLFIGVVAVYLDKIQIGIPSNMLPIMRACFFLPFYQFGYYYKSHLEKKDTLHNGWYFLILLIVQIDLFTRFTGNLGYYLYGFSFNENVFLPFITSLVGILFWLRVSKNIYNFVGSNKLIEYIGNNTWSIMVHHLFVAFLINWLLSTLVRSFDHAAFYSTVVWYRCISLPNWIYCLLAVLLPLLWQYYFDKWKKSIQLCVKKFII
ncbi:MAG: acyltransferase family protein [Prevotellaceae bacterium]|jgi:fucose 4-O-acetylase-like acetyltransferase|nr:acyltransferase family protein [Prevotellaceae bacterium]